MILSEVSSFKKSKEASCLAKRSTSESRQHGPELVEGGGTRYEQNFLAGRITASPLGKQRANTLKLTHRTITLASLLEIISLLSSYGNRLIKPPIYQFPFQNRLQAAFRIQGPR